MIGSGEGRDRHGSRPARARARPPRRRRRPPRRVARALPGDERAAVGAAAAPRTRPGRRAARARATVTTSQAPIPSRHSSARAQTTSAFVEPGRRDAALEERALAPERSRRARPGRPGSAAASDEPGEAGAGAEVRDPRRRADGLELRPASESATCASTAARRLADGRRRGRIAATELEQPRERAAPRRGQLVAPSASASRPLARSAPRGRGLGSRSAARRSRARDELGVLLAHVREPRRRVSRRASGVERGLEDREHVLDERLAAGHPLEVRPVAVVVRARRGACAGSAP